MAISPRFKSEEKSCVVPSKSGIDIEKRNHDPAKGNMMERIHRCEMCGLEETDTTLFPIAALSPGIRELIESSIQNPDVDSHICVNDLNRIRTTYINRSFERELENTLNEEDGDLGELTQRERESLDDRPADASFGERLADRVAKFGGSWTFILIFCGILCVWISLNTWHILWSPFDPFPYILLNLLLSCVAALQAPIIMMSQNRQESKDRKRAQSDYRVNLKAELEIRHLHEKVDHLLIEQWKRLVEIQKTQTALLERILGETTARK